MSLLWLGLLTCLISAKESDLDFKYYDFLARLKGKVREIQNHVTFFEQEAKRTRSLIVISYFSKKKCLQCERREDVLEDMVDSFKHQVEFYRFNCDAEMEAEDTPSRAKIHECHKNYPDKLPSIHFKTPENEAYYPYNPITFAEPPFEPEYSDPAALSQMIASFMPVYAKKITSMSDANDFVEKFGQLNKTLYFAESDQAPTYFKGLSSYFKDRLEFGLVSPDAHEVVEYFNVTSRPRWLVIKIRDAVKMEKRTYRGSLAFEDLRTYLSLFAAKEPIDREVNARVGERRIRDQVLKRGSEVRAEEFNYNDFASNFNYRDDVQIVHVTDTMSLNYPNLVIFQNFYG
jgi:hypothetical protein